MFCMCFFAYTQSLYTFLFILLIIYIRTNKISFFSFIIFFLFVIKRKCVHRCDPTIFKQQFLYMACQRVSRLRCRLIWLCMCAKFATLNFLRCWGWACFLLLVISTFVCVRVYVHIRENTQRYYCCLSTDLFYW